MTLLLHLLHHLLLFLHLRAFLYYILMKRHVSFQVLFI